jgi:hypothetical protein
MTANPRVVAAILRSDLYSFIRAIFPIVSSNDEFAANWHIEAIAYHLMCILQGDLKRLIITMPPRSLKSRFALRSHSRPLCLAIIRRNKSFV